MSCQVQITKKYDNTTSFLFIRTLGKFETNLNNTLKRLNAISNGDVQENIYELNWNQVLPLYYAHCANGDIDEFCSSHVHGYAMLNNFSSDDAMKEAMYLQLRAKLYACDPRAILNKNIPILRVVS